MIAAMNIRYNPEEWRLFIDSSMQSVRAVLLHKGNITAFNPCCLYRPQKGNISSALKVNAILMGLQNYVVSYVNGIVMPKVFTTARTGLYIQHIPSSFSILSNDRSKASSKMIPPHSAI